MRGLVLWFLAALDVATAVWLVGWGPFPLYIEEVGAPTAYLNIYVHVPAAMALYVAAGLAFVLAVWGLVRGLRRVELLDYSAYVVAAFGWYAFVSGTIWAAESWGSPWAMDPRQLSILVLAVVFSLYPAIKRGVEDPDRSVKLREAFVAAGFALALISLFAPYLAPAAFHPRPGATLGGSLRAYMGLRVAIVFALFIASLFVKPPRRLFLLYAAGAAAVLALMYPWLLYSPVRVVNVTAGGIVLADGRIVHVDPASVLSPAFVDGRPTLVGNFVVVDGGRVYLVRHYSAYVNAALYFLTMAAVLEVWRRLKR